MIKIKNIFLKVKGNYLHKIVIEKTNAFRAVLTS